MKELSQKEKDYLEGYAKALQDAMYIITGDNTSDKHYDPISFNEDVIYSYAYNFIKGGRKHPLKDFKSIEEIKFLMLKESVHYIIEDIENEIESSKERLKKISY